MERLDALLTGLEDEVLQSGQTGQHLVDEGIATETTRAMRASIESLILAREGDFEPRLGAPRSDHSEGVKAKVALVIERLGRWAILGQDGQTTSMARRVRMAFSGERPQKTRTEREATRHLRRKGESSSTQDEGR